MKSVMHNFGIAPSANITRSTFDLSHANKTTIFADKLYPFYLEEVIPADTITIDAATMARMSTPIAPLMDNLFLDTFFFFVPYRLVWDNWVYFMGERNEKYDPDHPDGEIEYAVPVITGTPSPDDLWDHFGLPMPISVTVGVNDKVNALPFRAYAKIYNDWFRRQSLIDVATLDTDDGPDALSDYPIKKRAKRPDYFTSCQPYPQKGSSVPLPLGTQAPVVGNGRTIGFELESGQYVGVDNGGTAGALEAATYNYDNPLGTTGGGTPLATNKILSLSRESGKSGMYVDLEEATASTINSLREAFQLQRLLERDARSGTRYVEMIKAHFQCVSPDFRLQRSEYLGGSSRPITISPVQQTAAKATADSTQTPLGTVGAFGHFFGRSGFSKSFTEHGVVIGIMNIRADLTYQQGLPRMFSRQTRYDFPFPVLAHLGEQEVLNKEIYAALGNGGTAADDQVFGYQERYAEMRYHPSKISGFFRSDHALTLDCWHLSEKFASLPALNQTFIESNTPMRRVLAVPGDIANPLPHFIVDQYLDVKAARPLPLYGEPGWMDHF